MVIIPVYIFFAATQRNITAPTHQSWAWYQKHHIKNTESCCMAVYLWDRPFWTKNENWMIQNQNFWCKFSGRAYLCKILKYPVDILTDTRQLQIVSRFLFGQKYKLARCSFWHSSKLKTETLFCVLTVIMIRITELSFKNTQNFSCSIFQCQSGVGDALNPSSTL